MVGSLGLTICSGRGTHTGAELPNEAGTRLRQERIPPAIEIPRQPPPGSVPSSTSTWIRQERGTLGHAPGTQVESYREIPIKADNALYQ